MLRALLTHHLTTWAILALPAIPFITELIPALGGGERYFAELMYETGLLGTQLLVLALALTPLQRIMRGWRPGSAVVGFLIKRRRAIGIASFGYAVLHTVFYLREIDDIHLASLEAVDLPHLTGWIALLMMAALAATSNRTSQRTLGPAWKPLQRFAYAVALLTALHWWLIGNFLDDLLFWTAILVALQIARVALNARRATSSVRR